MTWSLTQSEATRRAPAAGPRGVGGRPRGGAPRVARGPWVGRWQPMSMVVPSEREVLVADGFVGAERLGAALVADCPLLEHVYTIGEVQREIHILLGEQDGEPLALEPADLLAQMLDHQRGHPPGGLVLGRPARLPPQAPRA